MRGAGRGNKALFKFFIVHSTATWMVFMKYTYTLTTIKLALTTIKLQLTLCGFLFLLKNHFYQ